MALRYGFYNAKLVDGAYDRAYDAEDFGRFFDGIISDGVLPAYGKKFKVSKYSDTKVKVSTGKAWLNGTWTILDKAIALSVDTTAPITAIVLQINKNERTNSIITVSAGNTLKLVNDDDLGVYQYCLAYVKVANKVIASIESHVGNGSENVTPIASCLAGSGGGSTSAGTTGTMSASAYTTAIKFDDNNGFALTFKDEKGLTYVNDYVMELNSDGSIAAISNKTAGRSISVSYG